MSCTPCLPVFLTLYQLDLNSEFGGHSKGRMNYGVSLLCSNGKK